MADGFWEGFALDPRRTEHAAMRASDRDRDLVYDLLGRAYADGRLTVEEFDERTDQTTGARTLGDLPPLVSDLVGPTSRVLATTDERRADAEHRYRRRRQDSLMQFLVPTLICWAIWFGAGHGFPWPLFVMIGTGAGWVRMLIGREDHVRAIEKELARKERKQLEQAAPDVPAPGAAPEVDGRPEEQPGPH